MGALPRGRVSLDTLQVKKFESLGCRTEVHSEASVEQRSSVENGNDPRTK